MEKLRYIILSFIPIVLFSVLNIVLSLSNYRYPGSLAQYMGLVSSITIIPIYYVYINWKYRTRPILQCVFMIALMGIYVFVVGNEKLSFYINSDEKMWVGTIKLICGLSITEVTILWIATLIVWYNRNNRIALNRYIMLSVIPFVLNIISVVIVNCFDNDIRLLFMIISGINSMLVYTTYYYAINYFYRSAKHRCLQLLFACVNILCCWLIYCTLEFNLWYNNDFYITYIAFVAIFSVTAVMIPTTYLIYKEKN